MPQEELTPYQMLCLRVGELLVHAGLIGAAMHESEHFPEEVKENWEEKMDGIMQFLDTQIEEIQAFGSYFD